MTSWNNKFIKLRMTTLSDGENERVARGYMAAWIPVLWSGANARAEQKPAKAQPRARRRAHPAPRVRRPPPCPAGYICR